MAKTKSLALTTTPQQIVPATHCRSILIKEDESVTGWPTVGLVVRKPTAADDANALTAGKSYEIRPKFPQEIFVAGVATEAWIAVQAGSTTGIQDEQ